MRVLRGARYFPPHFSAAARESFTDKILNDLPNRTFTQALGFYDAWIEIASKIEVVDGQQVRRQKSLLSLLGCNDRFFLFTCLLNRVDGRKPWLFDRCRELEEGPDGYLDLWARFHYKSSLITFAGIIQEVLCDPEITIAIFSHTNPIAQSFLNQIKQEFEDNKRLQSLYPDVLYANPDKESPKWSSTEGILVRRQGNPKEATIEAYGLVEAQPVSRHYDLRVYDDIITEKAVTSPEQIQKVTKSWENSDNLGKADKSRRWHAGTRWSYADTYSIILDRKALRPRIYPATDNGRIDGKPVFLPKERWEEIKKTQRSTLSAQMLLNPVAGTDAMFHAEWFRGYEVIPKIMNVYIVVDPSKGKKKDSDRTAIAVIGIDPANNKYLLDGYRHRMRLSDRWAFLKALHAKWLNHPGVQLVRVGYEQYGMQADLEVIEEWQQHSGAFFEIEELNYPREGDHSKKARVERLEPDLRYGKFLLPGVVWNPDVMAEDHDPRKPNHTCLWMVWTEEREKQAEARAQKHNYRVGQIIHYPLRGLTKQQRYADRTGQGPRIVKPLMRRGEDGEIYDLTRTFMEEARFFPFAPHDDLIDVVSRIYDMEIHPPVEYERAQVLPNVEDDMVNIEQYADEQLGEHA